MKATIESSKEFEPITITLETEEEAELLWYMLQASGDAIEEMIGGCYNIPNRIDVKMFLELTSVFKPEGENDC